VEITEVDPFDGDAVRAWHDVHLRAEMHGREWANPWQLPEVLAELRSPGRRRRLLPFAAHVGGELVTAGALSLPQLDNLSSASLTVNTDPARRREGHGSAMLAHLEGFARAHARRLINTETFYPYAAPEDGSGHPYADFLTRRGYVFGLGDVHRVLDLPVDDALLDRLADEAAARHAGYRIEVFSGPVPERLLASFAAIEASLMTEAPAGDVERGPEAVDLEAFRQGEALLEAQGRTAYRAVAIDHAGEVVAYTNVMATVHAPDRCFQWGTVVDRGHRGRRLGLAVKVANLRLLQRESPGLELLFTYNAAVNAHMLAINDALGFRPVERLGEFQKRIAAADSSQN
jgi:GNAT superfamily N-acetyltransferase